MALRWGIASAGKISNDFVSALSNLPSADHKVCAVAARNLNDSKKFADLHNIPEAYEGYDALAKDANIEIVYVGSLHPYHYKIAMLMLQNNKHVLCEKPLCINYKEAKSLIDCARSKNLFLMEAVWSRFFPAYIALRELIKSGGLGEIFHVNVEFGQKISHINRLNTKEMGGGTILDLGIYNLQFAQMVFGCEPDKVVASGHLNDDGVDLSMSCVMTYSNGGTAVLSTHSQVVLSNYAIISGTKGSAKLHDFWCPTKLEYPDGSCKEFKLPTKGTYNFTNSSGLSYEAEECRKCIRAGLIESPIMSHTESLVLAKLEDNIRKQIGVHYKQDD